MPRKIRRTRICGRLIASAVIEDRTPRPHGVVELAGDLEDFIREFFHDEISFSYDKSIKGIMFVSGDYMAYLIRSVLQMTRSEKVSISLYAEDERIKLGFTFPEGFETMTDRFQCEAIASKLGAELIYDGFRLTFAFPYRISTALTLYEPKMKGFYKNLVFVFFDC